MRHLLTAFLFAAALCGGKACDVPQEAPALSCGRLCNSNIECSTDTIRRCRFCSFGRCAETLPVLTLDAGGVDSEVDAGSK